MQQILRNRQTIRPRRARTFTAGPAVYLRHASQPALRMELQEAAPRRLTEAVIAAYATHLQREERSSRTIEKYTGILRALAKYACDRTIDQDLLVQWKAELLARYKAATVNAMIAAVNGFCAFQNWKDCHLRAVKVQQKTYRNENKEMTENDYNALVAAAKKTGQLRLQLLMETLSATGIRISELQFITVEAIRQGAAIVSCKGKQRTVWLPRDLCKQLFKFAKRSGIKTGPVFVTKHGNPMDRSNIWHMLKRLCAAAGVETSKVFPHNFRRLFAVTYYEKYKDLAKLADLLGHSKINTTKIYIMESGQTHREQLEKLRAKST